jgi:large conductance mechanosensitive channel
MGMWHEFKQFAAKGNAIDMAVGIIIGAAFGKTITSLVNDVIMPPIGLLLGKVDFRNLEVILRKAAVSPTGENLPAVALRYGAFISTIVDFLIVAFTIFVVIRAVNRLSSLRQKA